MRASRKFDHLRVRCSYRESYRRFCIIEAECRRISAYQDSRRPIPIDYAICGFLLRVRINPSRYDARLA